MVEIKGEEKNKHDAAMVDAESAWNAVYNNDDPNCNMSALEAACYAYYEYRRKEG